VTTGNLESSRLHVFDVSGAEPRLLITHELSERAQDAHGVSRAFITLRGPNPAPTIPHATVGETPGVAIVDVETRELLKVVELGDPVDSDFHGIFVPAADG